MTSEQPLNSDERQQFINEFIAKSVILEEQITEVLNDKGWQEARDRQSRASS